MVPPPVLAVLVPQVAVTHPAVVAVVVAVVVVTAVVAAAVAVVEALTKRLICCGIEATSRRSLLTQY